MSLALSYEKDSILSELAFSCCSSQRDVTIFCLTDLGQYNIFKGNIFCDEEDI